MLTKKKKYCKLSCQFAVQELSRMTSLLEHTVASQPNVDFWQKKDDSTKQHCAPKVRSRYDICLNALINVGMH